MQIFSKLHQLVMRGDRNRHMQISPLTPYFAVLAICTTPCIGNKKIYIISSIRARLRRDRNILAISRSFDKMAKLFGDQIIKAWLLTTHRDRTKLALVNWRGSFAIATSYSRDIHYRCIRPYSDHSVVGERFRWVVYNIDAKVIDSRIATVFLHTAKKWHCSNGFDILLL